MNTRKITAVAQGRDRHGNPLTRRREYEIADVPLEPWTEGNVRVHVRRPDLDVRQHDGTNPPRFAPEVLVADSIQDVSP